MARSNPQAKMQELEMLFSARRYTQVISAIEPMLRGVVPPRLRYMHGASLARLGKLHLALPSLKAAEPAMPKNVGLLYDLSQCYLAEGSFDPGLKLLDRVLSLEPRHALAIGAKAEALQVLGRHDEATTMLEQARADGVDDPAVLVAHARLAPKHRDLQAAVDDLEPIVEEQVASSPYVRMTALFRLGALLDKAGRHDEAFARIKAANELADGSFEPAKYRANIEAIMEAWTPEAIGKLPKSRETTERPVFIVGVPRSGTSLVEQILASHPEVHGAGELELMNPLVREMEHDRGQYKPLVTDLGRLTQPVLDRAARKYLRELEKLDRRASRVTDKMPMNLHHVGLIRQMFPGARIILCSRDPRDTGLSCYFQHFAYRHPYTNRLDWMGSFWADADRLAEHWRGLFPEEEPASRMMSVRYEDLVADQERVSRALVAFLGLEWDDACLRFHESARVTRTASNEQVRQPMYSSSVGRWKAYESHLGPMIEALGDRVEGW